MRIGTASLQAHPGRLPWTTYLFSLAQAINLTAAVISVTIAALVGSRLAATAALGTVPYGIQFAAVMLCTYPASMLMRRYGRRLGFCVGAIALMGAGAVGYAAVSTSSFALLTAAHALLGVYMACANFYRFAAVDTLPSAIKAKGISLVVAGGILAAVLGPAIAGSLRSVPGHAEFALCYAALIGLGVASLLLMAIWRPEEARPHQETPASSASAPAAQGWTLAIATAMFAAAGGYLIMNLLMIQASLVMKGICSFDASSRAIQAHVVAMFAPSFFTGTLLARIGLRQTLLLGFALLAAAAALGMTAISYESVFAGLVLLGLGWNFTYVGGGALLAGRVDDTQRLRWQGINDSLIAVCATLGAFLPAPLLAALGWQASNLFAVPLCLLGAVLCWKTLTPGGKHVDRVGAARATRATSTTRATR